MNQSTVTRRIFLAGSAAAIVAAGASAANVKSAIPLYCMDTGLVGPDVPALADQVALVKELGFSGIEVTLGRHPLADVLKQVDAAGIELTGIYATPSLEEPLHQQILDAAKLLAGRPTRIELAIGSRHLKSSDPAGDKSAIELLKRVSDACSDNGPLISIYPHTGNWVERVDDGVRLASQVNRPNVGTNFNLVHWKWVPQQRPLAQALREALPYLKLVTINGLAGRAIVPLDQGDYDLAGFMATLSQVGYTGRVGLQGYGIKGSSREHLSASMKKWRQLTTDAGPAK